MTRFDKQKNEVLAFRVGPEELPSASFFWSGKSICLQTKDGSTWIGTTGGGLCRISPLGKRIASYLHDDSEDSSLANNNVRILYEDRDGRLLVGTENGLDVFDEQRNSFLHFRPDGRNKGSLSGSIVISILHDSKGNLWVGTESHGLNKSSDGGKSFHHYRYVSNDDKTIGDDRVTFLWEDDEGTIWCSHETHLSIYHPKEDAFERYDDEVTCALSDEHGDIWCLFNDGKLGRLKRGVPRFQHYKHDPDNPNSLASDIVVTIYEDRDKLLWISSLGGFTCYDRFRGKFKRYQYDVNDYKKIPSTMGYSPGIYEHSDGTFYIGTAMPATLCVFNRQKGEVVKRYEHSPSNETSMPDASQVNRIIEDKDEKDLMWLATAKGVVSFNRRLEEFRVVIDADSWDVYDDGRGVIWATTWGKGVARYNKKNNVIDFLGHLPHDPTSISGNVTVPIFKASDGRLWIGANNGLNLLDVDKGTFTRYSTPEGYAWESIHSIGEDKSGCLWLGTAGGLGRFDPLSGEARLYTKEDGVQASMFYALNGIRTDDGRMWFGGVKGMNSFLPESIKDNERIPKVVLTSLTQGGAPFATETAPEFLKSITLDWQSSFFEFEFVAFEYTNPRRNKYAYKLDGLDKTFYQAGARNYGRYSAIPPGQYTLLLRGSNNDGKWNEKGQSITINVLPPFWQTLWFRTMGAISLILVFLAIVFYVWRLREEIRQRERAEKELKRLDQLKDEFLANTSHELRTPLNGIIGLAEALLDGVAGPLPESAVRDLSMIVASGRRLASLVNDILDFSKLRHKDLLLSIGPLDIAAVVDVVLAVSRTMVGDKKLSLLNDVSRDLLAAAADENRVQQILFNLIGNAIKFTAEGEVRVKARTQGNYVSITVSDTGIGIPKTKMDSIFVPFEQVDGTAAREFGGTGLGLSVTKQLVELHGGVISVSSEERKGSSFTFTLPLSEERAQKSQSSAIDRIPISNIVYSDEQQTEVSKGMQGSVLIVDDEAVNLQVLRNQLQLQDYDVTIANNGNEALAAIDEKKFDIVLLDVMMPGMTGYEVCRKLREKHGQDELPVLLVTAKNRVQDLVCGFKSGANDYIAKPFTRRELIARVETHLQLKNLFSEKVEAERELRRMEEQLLQAQKMEAIGTLAAGIAHDFNNLLQGILGYTQLLLEETSSQGETNIELAQIEKASLRAADLIRDLLTFSRKEKSNLELLDFKRQILNAKKLLDRTLPKMVEVIVELDDDLWHINGDKQHIEQVILNLATNACDAMDGSGRLLVEATNVLIEEHTELEAGHYIRLSLSDNGCGMTDDTKRRVFEPFFTTKEIGKGTGLGMSTVFGIVKTHSGHIECLSELGKGTTFHIWFPACEERLDNSEKVQDSIVYPEGTETILLVDDEQLVLDMSSRFFERLGYSVILSKTGEECLEILGRDKDKIDLVILDIGMPGMGGRECALALKSRFPEQKVIIATGYGGVERGESAHSLGARALLAKPFDLETMANTVRQALDNR